MKTLTQQIHLCPPCTLLIPSPPWAAHSPSNLSPYFSTLFFFNLLPPFFPPSLPSGGLAIPLGSRFLNLLPFILSP